MISSTRARFDWPLFYIGWNTDPQGPLHSDDPGDETFGVALGSLYVGHYSGTGWCWGICDANGLLPESYK